MMMMIILFLPRTEGNRWKLQKFHELLHVAKHINDYGSPLNWDAGTGERGLKFWVKEPVKTVQQRGQHVYNAQLANWVYVSAIMDKATMFAKKWFTVGCKEEESDNQR